MIATGHQPLYYGYLGTLHKMAHADVYIAWDDVQREDSGYENRTRILGPNGAQWLTVPIYRSRDAKIKDILIASEHDWQRKHMRTLEQVYHKAPHWAQYEPVFRHIYGQRWELLADLNATILTFLLREFSVPLTERVALSTYKLASTKTQLIVDACKRANAWKYIFGQHGPDYADVPLMRAAGLEPMVQRYEAQVYTQGSDGAPFVPNLFPFDALLWHGPDVAREIMLSGGRITRME